MNDKKKKRGILRKVRFRTLFFLALTLASNTFAWFVYSTRVSNNINAKVRSWHVNFIINGSEAAEEYIELNVDSLYPGMDTYTKTLTASNTGESRAQISYEVVTANVLGDDLVGIYENSDTIINKLRNDYPFKIDFNVSNPIIEADGGESSVSISVSWPYESGDDEEDTRWGTLAYDYHDSHPDLYSISVLVKITAVQIEE